MKLKFKLVSAACVALCSAGAFAATPPVVCNSTTLAGLINTCAPEVTVFTGGASAQSAAMNTVLTAGAGIFDTSAIRGKITLVSSTSSGSGGATVGYIGRGAAGTTYAGKRVLVVYNKSGGAGAGVKTLLEGKGPTGEEVTLVTATVKNLAKGIAGTCAAVEPATVGALGTATCATEAPIKSAWGVDAQKSMHMAISDVRPTELTPGVIKKWDATKFPAERLSMQGFGVMVNPTLYTALIASEVAAGQLASSCLTSEVVGGGTGTTDTITAACQPNLTKALYSSIITGKIASGADLFGAGDTKKIYLARRVDSSGTQATSNIFFGGLAGYNAKTPAVDGYVTVLGAANSTASLIISEGSATGDVLNTVSGAAAAADYALGVVSLENIYSKTVASSKLKGGLYVKIDGKSPNLLADNSVDPKHRAALQNGYSYAMEAFALKPTTLAGDYLDIYSKLVAALTIPSGDLPGHAYIGSSDASKNTAFTHSGNNFSPLVKN